MNDNHTYEQALISALERLMPILERIQRRELTADDIQRIQATGIDMDQLYEVIP